MAEQREVFTILEDNSTAAGVKLPARATGDASGGNHVPSLVAFDNSSNYALIQLRAIGNSVAGNHVASVVAQDDTGYQLIRLRAEGDTVTGVEIPVLPAKDSAGDYAHIPINASGQIPVSLDIGTELSDNGTVTSTALNTEDIVATVSLTASTDYKSLDISVASTFHTTWKVYNVDDAAGTPVETLLLTALTGPGCFSFAHYFRDLKFTSGSTGTQELQVKGSQLHGALTDKHAFVSIVEL